VAAGTPTPRRRLEFGPRAYERIAWAALATLTLIVFTGAAVRLTDSGLGCPDWPRCHGKPYPPLDTNAMIEFGNRLVSIPVTIAVALAVFGAYRRVPRRNDLIAWAWLLPAGVVAQAALGALTVKGDLEYGWVMAHFGLSMLIAIAAVGLVWLARHEPGWRPRSTDRVSVWSVRALGAVGALAVVSGVFATAAGPHSGGEAGQTVSRFVLRGGDTFSWVVHRHGNFSWALGVATIAVLVLLHVRHADIGLRRSVAAVGVLVAAQGTVGLLQYHNQLPAELVWLHVVLVTLTWLALIWSVAWAGRLGPGRATARASRRSEDVGDRGAQQVHV
jgi:cytochrome c oxidase assembly protein subunit 15